MPFAQIKSVREVSSEDLIHSANNLISQLPGKKWKTKGIGEKFTYVILELTKPEQITGIDIGNEHSAFIEVQVGKAGLAKEDFKEILITSSFMTPIESKNSTTVNRVRCFSQEALVSDIAANKWQQIKIVCTQPFNKHVQYGISFIKLHVLEGTIKERPKYLAPEKNTKRTFYYGSNNTDVGLSKFLRENSPDSDSESTTALFKRWKNSRKINEHKNNPSTAVTIRHSSKIKNINSNKKLNPISSSLIKNDVTESKNNRVIDQNKNFYIIDGKEKEDINDSRIQNLNKQINSDREYLRDQSEYVIRQDNKKLKQSIDTVSFFEHNKHMFVTPNVLKKEKEATKLQQYGQKKNISPINQIKSESTEVQYRPFNQLLRGIVLVISGIQNPDRSNLRNKALALGAKYKTDWDQDCTHLICAFKNTPKYNKVEGKGKIVSKYWIEKCFALKKYLPWRRYALDSSELIKNESDEEILDENFRMNLTSNSRQAVKSSQNSKKNFEPKDSLCMYDLGESDDEKNTNTKDVNFDNLGSESDTDDEIHRATQRDVQLKNNRCNIYPSNSKSIYEAETEEEDFLREKVDLNKTYKHFCEYNYT